MKKLCDFTINEYREYQLLAKDIDENIEYIFKLFDINTPLNKMSLADWQKNMTYINNQSIKNEKKGVKKEYYVGGMKIKACLDLTTINASQFIDLQSALNGVGEGENKVIVEEDLLSVFLIPYVEKKVFGLINTKRLAKYADKNDYNINQFKDQLADHFTIGDYAELSSFFLSTSTALLGIINSYLRKKRVKMLERKVKKEKKQM